jgi:hypothetical protein
MKRHSLLVIAMLALGTHGVAVAEQAKPAPTYETAILNTWRNLHNKILTMAKDTVFPDDKLGWRPIRMRAACSRNFGT